VTLTSVLSKAMSISGISEGNNSGLLGGNGEGARGPIGRRSDECCDVEREWWVKSIEIGVVDLGVGVVERKVAISLDARDAGRVGCGGSSKTEGQRYDTAWKIKCPPSYMVSSTCPSKTRGAACCSC
jgi:hypothetical protein